MEEQTNIEDKKKPSMEYAWQISDDQLVTLIRKLKAWLGFDKHPIYPEDYKNKIYLPELIQKINTFDIDRPKHIKALIQFIIKISMEAEEQKERIDFIGYRVALTESERSAMVKQLKKDIESKDKQIDYLQESLFNLTQRVTNVEIMSEEDNDTSNSEEVEEEDKEEKKKQKKTYKYDYRKRKT